jgi:hypothetical protein
MVVEAGDAALPRHVSVLLCDGRLGTEQGTEGIEAEEQVWLPREEGA